MFPPGTVGAQADSAALRRIPERLEEIAAALRQQHEDLAMLVAVTFALHVSMTKVPVDEMAPLVRKAYDAVRAQLCPERKEEEMK